MLPDSQLWPIFSSTDEISSISSVVIFTCQPIPRPNGFLSNESCSFLLAVRSELLEEAPQIFRLLLVLNPRKHHFGARNLRLGIFDVFLEGRFVPDDPGIFVRIRVIVAWHRA